MNKEEIRQKYEKMARWYDLREGIFEVLVIGRLRKRLLRRASGKVLEIAVGTGKNLSFYSKDCQITGVDISRAMLEHSSALGPFGKADLANEAFSRRG